MGILQPAREWSSEHHFPIQGGCHGPQGELAMHLNHLSDVSDHLSNTTTASSLQFRRDIITLGPNIDPTLLTTSALQGFTQTLKNVRQFQKAEICVDDQINQNALICAITEGWDALGSHGKVCPLWRLLQRCDDLIFRRASHITRLVMLWMIHQMSLVSISLRPASMLRFIIDSFKFKVCGKRLDQLPHWYRPRCVNSAAGWFYVPLANPTTADQRNPCSLMMKLQTFLPGTFLGSYLSDHLPCL